MGFNDDNFLDDYEIQELINKFESQLESGMPLFFDADELNIILEHYVQKNDIPKINIIADLASTYHEANPLTKLIMAKKYLSVQDAANALPYLLDESNNADDPDYQLSLGYCYSLMDEHKKSLSAYKKAVKLRPNDAFIYIFDNILHHFNQFVRIETLTLFTSILLFEVFQKYSFTFLFLRLTN